MPLRPDDTSFLHQLHKVQNAGVDVISINIACGRQTFEQARALCHTFTQWIGERSNRFVLVQTAGEAQKAKLSGKLGICFDIEGGDALDGDIRNVEKLYYLGVRWMLPVYNKNNALGGGCLDTDGGLTDYGRDVVAEMNRVGMVVCASHCGHRTAMDLINVSSSPVIFSHSNSDAVWQHPRNIPDELMRACAHKGGVVGINGFALFLGEGRDLVEGVAAHIEHAVKVIGEDHVGLALDYVFDMSEFYEYMAADPETFPPEIYAEGAPIIEHQRLKDVYDALKSRGYTDTALAKIFGLNHLRIATEVWNAPIRNS